MSNAQDEQRFWIAQVEPLPGESIANYLLRFRRLELNSISAPSALSLAADLGFAINQWERFQFNPFPAKNNLKKLKKFIGLEAEQLFEMFPPESERKHFLHNTIRLCAACCVESLYHRLSWQFHSVSGCDQHRLRLLSKCPHCEKKFSIDAPFWINGKCECGMRAGKMVKHQKPYESWRAPHKTVVNVQ